MSTAFLLAAATCLAWDGAGSSYAGNPPGGSYGGLENGYDPAAWAAWAAIIAGRDSPYGGIRKRLRAAAPPDAPGKVDLPPPRRRPD